MNRKKKYTINDNTTNKTNKTNTNITNTKNKNAKSIDGYECIGPCHPPNTFYYNPSNLGLIINPYPSCPIKEQKITNSDGSVYKKISAQCGEEDINKGNLYFDIFSDNVQIATNSDNFLAEIYNLNNISDVVRFLSNDFDILPIYTQRRLLEAIYFTYYKFVEFPKLLFAKKLLFVLENIYEITNLNPDKIVFVLNEQKISNQNNLTDFYNLFY